MSDDVLQAVSGFDPSLWSGANGARVAEEVAATEKACGAASRRPRSRAVQAVVDTALAVHKSWCLPQPPSSIRTVHSPAALICCSTHDGRATLTP